MATRRRHSVHCGIVANVRSVVALYIFYLIAGCTARDDAAGGRTDGGPLGEDDAGGMAQGDTGGATISCNPTGSGCLCIVDDSQPGQLAACSPTSVTQSPMEQGVCCVALSLCACI